MYTRMYENTRNIDLFDLNTITKLPEDTECDLIFYSMVWRM